MAMEMVCCSIASWIATRSSSRILSNSSMQTHPPSASTIAPPSSMKPPSESLTTDAVKPAADEPLPEVYTQMGAVFSTNLRNWDFAVDGSPIRSTLTSPRSLAPSCVVLRDPENRRVATAALMSSAPKMAGAILCLMSAMTSLNGLAAKALNSVCSASVKCASPRAPSLSSVMPTTRMYGVEIVDDSSRPRLPIPIPRCKVYTPMTLTLVPGVMRWTMVRSTCSIMCRGISPAGTSSGFSCSFSVCTSQNLLFSAIGT